MALQDDINIFINKAQTKIGLYTDEIEPLLRKGIQSNFEVEMAVELIEFLESLQHVNCPWTDEEKIYWMAFMEVRHNLTDVVYQDYDPYQPAALVILGPGAGGVTLDQLYTILVAYTNVDISLQNQINSLITQIGNLPDFYADFLALQIVVNGHTLTIGSIQDAITALNDLLLDHINDTEVHIQPGERDAWNARITQQQLDDALTTKADVNHTHPISDIEGLQEELDDLQEQIDNIAGQDGITPNIQIGSVVEGDFPSVELDPMSTPEIPIFNFVLKSGDPFRIDAAGLLSDKFLYDNQPAGFTFLDLPSGEIWIRMGNAAGVWAGPIPFKGDNGWTPIYSYNEVSSSRVIKILVDWVGGTGSKPNLDVIYSKPAGTTWYAGPSGFTDNINLATNVKGPSGDRFRIDVEGEDRSLYNNEPKGFTFLNLLTGKVSFKLSDTSGDWSDYFTWVGYSTEWEVITSNVNGVGRKGYIVSDPGRIEVTLNQDYLYRTIRLAANDIGGWRVICPPGTTVVFVDEEITEWLQSTSIGDAIELLNVAPNRWQVISCMGNIEYGSSPSAGLGQVIITGFLPQIEKSVQAGLGEVLVTGFAPSFIGNFAGDLSIGLFVRVQNTPADEFEFPSSVNPVRLYYRVDGGSWVLQYQGYPSKEYLFLGSVSNIPNGGTLEVAVVEVGEIDIVFGQGFKGLYEGYNGFNTPYSEVINSSGSRYINIAANIVGQYFYT
jgi:hypothetical protein